VAVINFKRYVTDQHTRIMLGNTKPHSFIKFLSWRKRQNDSHQSKLKCFWPFCALKSAKHENIFNLISAGRFTYASDKE